MVQGLGCGVLSPVIYQSSEPLGAQVRFLWFFSDAWDGKFGLRGLEAECV